MFSQQLIIVLLMRFETTSQLEGTQEAFEILVIPDLIKSVFTDFQKQTSEGCGWWFDSMFSFWMTLLIKKRLASNLLQSQSVRSRAIDKHYCIRLHSADRRRRTNDDPTQGNWFISSECTCILRFATYFDDKMTDKIVLKCARSCGSNKKIPRSKLKIMVFVMKFPWQFGTWARIDWWQNPLSNFYDWFLISNWRHRGESVFSCLIRRCWVETKVTAKWFYHFLINSSIIYIINQWSISVKWAYFIRLICWLNSLL